MFLFFWLHNLKGDNYQKNAFQNQNIGRLARECILQKDGASTGRACCQHSFIV